MSDELTMRECLMLDIRNLEDQRDFAISEMERLKRERDEARKSEMAAILERERWKMLAEEKWAMRVELEELLGVKDTQCNEQFAKGLAALRDLIKERNEAREAFAIATDHCVVAQAKLREGLAK
jgi:hypothetical protein